MMRRITIEFRDMQDGDVAEIQADISAYLQTSVDGWGAEMEIVDADTFVVDYR